MTNTDDKKPQQRTWSGFFKDVYEGMKEFSDGMGSGTGYEEEELSEEKLDKTPKEKELKKSSSEIELDNIANNSELPSQNRVAPPSPTGVADAIEVLDAINEQTTPVKKSVVATNKSSEEIDARTADLRQKVSRLIREFPTKIAEANKPRVDTYNKLNDLQKISTTADNPQNAAQANAYTLREFNRRIEEIMQRPDFKLHTIGTAKTIEEKNLSEARKILKAELQVEIDEAKLLYQEKKRDVDQLTREFESDLIDLSKKIDFNSFKLPNLDEYSSEQKDIIFRGIDSSKKAFPAKRTAPSLSAGIKPKANKTITEAEALKSVGTTNINLENYRIIIDRLNSEFSNSEFTRILEKSTIVESQIYEDIAREKGLKPEDFNREKRFDNGEDPKFKEAYDEIYARYSKTPEFIAVSEFTPQRKKVIESALVQLKADLAPLAVKIHQLNEALPPEERLDSKALNSYIGAVYSKAIQDAGIQTDASDKGQFIKEIDDITNRQTYQYSESELTSISNPLAKMGEIFVELGVKPEILDNLPKRGIQTAKDTKSPQSVSNKSTNSRTISKDAEISETEVKANQQRFEDAITKIKEVSSAPKGSPEETRLKEGLAALVEAFPSVAREADKPREEAFKKYNDLNKMLKLTETPQATAQSNPEIIERVNLRLEEIMKRPDFLSETMGTPRYKKEKNLTQARKILKAELSGEVSDAHAKYQAEKERASVVTKQFEEVIIGASSKIDLESFRLPSLDSYSAEQKDSVYKAIENSRKTFTKQKEAKKSPKTESSSKTITEAAAKKSVIDIGSPSPEFSSLVSEYKKYSNTELQILMETNQTKLSEIFRTVSDELTAKSTEGFKPEEFSMAMIGENGGNSPYKEAYEKAFALHAKSDEARAIIEFNNRKKAAQENSLDQLKADLAPHAIRLHQLNASLPENERIDSKALNAYLGAAYSSIVEREKLLDNPGDRIRDRSSFILELDHPTNKRAYQFNETDLASITDKKAQMQEILGKIGIKPQIMDKVVEAASQEKPKLDIPVLV